MSFIDLLFSYWSSVTGIAHLVVAILSFFPLLLNLKYFIQLRISDYLWLTIFFLMTGPYVLIEVFLFEQVYNTPLYYFASTFWFVPLFVVGVRAKWEYTKDIPTWVWGVVGFLVVIFLVSIIDEYTVTSYWYFESGEFFFGRGPTTPIAMTSTTIVWMFWINRIILAGLTAYFFISSGHINVKRTRISRGLWIGHTSLWCLMMMGFLISIGLFGYPWDGSQPVVEIIVFTPFILGSILVLINHIFFPESVLVTEEQVHRAFRMYKQVSLSNNVFMDLGIGTVKSYIDNLPPELVMVEK